jgi:hypothetical protein
MKKRIVFSIMWGIGLPAMYLVASMLMFAVLGLAGFAKTPPPQDHSTAWRAFGMFGVIGGIWAWLFLASPVVGFTLAFFGRLPGTRRTTKQILG